MTNMAPKRDMLAALRLTRNGRLKEAMAVLRGGGQPPAPPAAMPAPGIMQSLLHLPDMLQDALGEIQPPAGPHRPGDTEVPAGARFEARSFSNAAGSRKYKLYIPGDHHGAALPLLVMLHGCTQSPDDFAAGTRMNELAERHKFLVAYPAQARGANINKCWNWFKPEDQRREHGEPSIIAGITREIAAEFRVPAKRVFIAGMSAGGAMAATMGTAYPELYAGIGVHSGLASGAAHDLPSAMAAMRDGGAAQRGKMPPVIVFHGDADHTVNPVNAGRIVTGAVRETINGSTATGAKYTCTMYPDAALWMLHGVGHGWSGGSPAGSFTAPKGPDASAEMVRFFGLAA